MKLKNSGKAFKQVYLNYYIQKQVQTTKHANKLLIWEELNSILLKQGLVLNHYGI